MQDNSYNDRFQHQLWDFPDQTFLGWSGPPETESRYEAREFVDGHDALGATVEASPELSAYFASVYGPETQVQPHQVTTSEYALYQPAESPNGLPPVTQNMNPPLAGGCITAREEMLLGIESSEIFFSLGSSQVSHPYLCAEVRHCTVFAVHFNIIRSIFDRQSQPLDTLPTMSSSDTTSLLHTSYPHLDGDRPKPEGKAVNQHESTHSMGTDTDNSRLEKLEKDSERHQKSREEEHIYLQRLKVVFGQQTTKYDLVYNGGQMLGIPIKPKAPKRKLATRCNAMTKEEKKNQRKELKKAAAIKDREMMKAALDTIAKFFEMRKATSLETLAVLAEAVTLHQEKAHRSSYGNVAIPPSS